MSSISQRGSSVAMYSNHSNAVMQILLLNFSTNSNCQDLSFKLQNCFYSGQYQNNIAIVPPVQSRSLFSFYCKMFHCDYKYKICWCILIFNIYYTGGHRVYWQLLADYHQGSTWSRFCQDDAERSHTNTAGPRHCYLEIISEIICR